jgi:hypothetical protein
MIHMILVRLYVCLVVYQIVKEIHHYVCLVT